jgi:hypothetical protein
MAKQANDKQPFIIALIVFVLLTFVLAVSNYFAYKWAFDSQKAMEAKQKEASDENSKRLEAENKRLELVKDVLGFSEDMDNAAILEAKKQRIDVDFGGYLAKENKLPTYADAFEWLSKWYKGKEEELTQANTLKDEAERQKNKLAEEQKQSLADLNKKLGDLQEELKKERDGRAEDDQKNTEQKNQLVAEKEAAEKKLTRLKTLSEEIAKGEQYISAARRKKWPGNAASEEPKGDADAPGGGDEERVTVLLDEMKAKDRMIAELNDVVARIRVADPALQKTVRAARPVDDRVDGFDGRILSVNEIDRTVLFSVGSTTGIRPGLIFDVYDPVDPQPQFGMRKGVVEVVGIEGGSLVRARVRQDATRDPILPGDAVATSLWSPGAALEVVLVGVPQFGGDAAVDAERFRRIVERIGGRVETTVTPSTTMVVDAGIPKQKGIDPERQALRKPMTQKEKESREKLIKEAERLGIKVVAIEPFLGMMGLQLDAVGANRLPVPADQRAAPARTENVAY